MLKDHCVGWYGCKKVWRRLGGAQFSTNVFRIFALGVAALAIPIASAPLKIYRMCLRAFSLLGTSFVPNLSGGLFKNLWMKMVRWMRELGTVFIGV
ncbi:MAG: hypothetical protein Q8754_03025, partial [Sweet potato little leaf phytoplasma]|nr:hypothetical protein [Sweet potato little leaf phytoplasma]